MKYYKKEVKEIKNPEYSDEQWNDLFMGYVIQLSIISLLVGIIMCLIDINEGLYLFIPFVIFLSSMIISQHLLPNNKKVTLFKEYKFKVGTER